MAGHSEVTDRMAEMVIGGAPAGGGRHRPSTPPFPPPCCWQRERLCGVWGAFLHEDIHLPPEYEKWEHIWANSGGHLCYECTTMVGTWPLPLMDVADWMSSTFVYHYGLPYLAPDGDRFTRTVASHLETWLAIRDNQHWFSSRPRMLWLMIHAGHRPDTDLRWVDTLWNDLHHRRTLPEHWSECLYLLECALSEAKTFEETLRLLKTYVVALVHSATQLSHNVVMDLEDTETLELRQVQQQPEDVALKLATALESLRELVDTGSLSPWNEQELLNGLAKRTRLAFSHHSYSELFDEERAVRLLAFWNAAHRAIKHSGVFSSLPESAWWNGEGFLELALWTDDTVALESLAQTLRPLWLREIPRNSPRSAWAELATLRMWQCSHLRYARSSEDEEILDPRAPKLIARRRLYSAGLVVQMLRGAAFCPLLQLAEEALIQGEQKYHEVVDKFVPGWRDWDLL